MKMNLTINIEIEGRDAEALLVTLLALKKDPLQPIDTEPGTVGNEFLSNKNIEIDLTQYSSLGARAFRMIRWTCMSEDGQWLRDMPWNTFLLELREPDGGKIAFIRNVGPVSIAALRAVFLGADTNKGDDDAFSEPTP
jgi:hypothetical protein